MLNRYFFRVLSVAKTVTMRFQSYKKITKIICGFAKISKYILERRNISGLIY